MKSTAKMDAAPIVVNQAFAKLCVNHQTRVFKTGDFRLLDCYHDSKFNRVEVSCFYGRQIRGTLPVVHLQQLETWIGQTVQGEFTFSESDDQNRLVFSRLELIKASNDPLQTIKPMWLPQGGENYLKQLHGLVQSLDAPYRSLVNKCFEDDDLLESFLRNPASLGHHHAEQGGLLRHSVEVALDCLTACQYYSDANTNLAVTAALLHDIGKCLEYIPTGNGRYSRSQTGELEMHKLQGAAIIKIAAKGCDTNPLLVSEIIHCITAANGQDYMGLARPKILEATLVQTADTRSAAADLYRSKSKFAFNFSHFGGTYADQVAHAMHQATIAEPKEVNISKSFLPRAGSEAFRSQLGWAK